MFDPRAARALAAGEHIVIDGAPGLRLVASATARAWTYRYRSPVDGRMRQVRLGRWPAMGLPAALATWQDLKAVRDAGGDPAAERRTRKRVAAESEARAQYTVRKACDEYLRGYRATVADKTFREANRMLHGVALDKIAAREAAGITRADAYATIDAIRDHPVQAANLRRLLGAVWDRALDAGRLPPECPNWWRLILRGQLRSRGKVVAGRHQGVRRRALSEPELAALLRWWPNWSRDVEDALTLMLWTGCRGAEVVAMQAAEVADERGVLWWTIPRHKLKMRRSAAIDDLRVPLVGRSAAIVRRRLTGADAASGGWLFASPGRSGHVEQKALGVAVWTHHAVCKLRPEWVRPRLPVADWAPHDLRRTGRTMLAALGCPVDVAEAILGHIPPGVQGTYNRHRYDAERLLWLTAWADRLEALARQA